MTSQPPALPETETEYCDRLWPDGWETHLCDRGEVVTHSRHYHHPHELCCPMHQKECLVDV